MNQRLGVYTFEWDPDRYSIPKYDRTVATVQTYTSHAFFSWGIYLNDKIVLEWDWMSVAQWDALYAMYIADATVKWQDGNSLAFNVEILNLEGSYFESVGPDLAYRKDVKLELYLASVSTYATTTITTTTSTTITLP